MAKINTQTLSHKELKTLIKTVGKDLTVVVTGEPGVGKSSVLRELAEEMPSHIPVYVDAPVFDIPDIMMPMVDTESKITHFAPNALWHFQDKKPLIIMIDELLKASGPTKLILTRLILERTLGDFQLPEGSIVFATSNNATDGVGDNIAAHLQNRICMVNLRKPTAKEWLTDFAFAADIAPEICAWVKQFPQCMESYTHFDKKAVTNPYIFDPAKGGKQGAFVSPRSLAKASVVVKNRKALGPNATVAALGGVVGYSAAGDMHAFLEVADKLPAFELITMDPKKTPIPTKDPAAMLVLVFGCAARSQPDNIKEVVEYITRMPEEYQLLFMSSLTQNSTKRWSSSTKLITDWHLKNKQLLISDIDD
jgi:energy-coupling factor transporter ATP-binding protein EcfA2